MNRQDPTPPGAHKAARAPSVSAEEMLRVLTHSVGATVAVIGRDLRFVYANEEFATWLDMTPEQLRGRAMREEAAATARAVLATHPNEYRAYQLLANLISPK